MKTNGNDSANALSEGMHAKMVRGYTPNAGEDIGTGLTKREHFAAMAMQGFCSMDDKLGSWENEQEAVDALAAMSVRQADALINALNKDQP